jgi:hypothetical protein
MLVPIKLIFAKILAANPLQNIKFVKTLRFAAKVFAMPTSQKQVYRQFYHRLCSKINLFTFDWNRQRATAFSK